MDRFKYIRLSQMDEDLRRKHLELIEESKHCPACYKFYVEDDLYLLKLGADNPKMDLFLKQSLEDVRKNCPAMYEKYRAKYNPSRDNHAPKGVWAGTLTMAPTDGLNEEEMVSAIKKIFKQKTCPVMSYAWYLEYTEAGLPHIHFVYKRQDGARIHRKVFKRVWKIWDEDRPCGVGHRGGYHRLCHSEDEYLKYISKDKGRHDVQWTAS